jgi:hypothetical protein
MDVFEWFKVKNFSSENENYKYHSQDSPIKTAKPMLVISSFLTDIDKCLF